MLDRVQSLLMYDCNQGSIDAIDAETQAMRRRERFASLPVIVPGYLPKVDGFLRDPNAYKDYFGLIHRDMERMVDTVTRRAEEVGSPPQIILDGSVSAATPSWAACCTRCWWSVSLTPCSSPSC